MSQLHADNTAVASDELPLGYVMQAEKVRAISALAGVVIFGVVFALTARQPGWALAWPAALLLGVAIGFRMSWGITDADRSHGPRPPVEDPSVTRWRAGLSNAALLGALALLALFAHDASLALIVAIAECVAASVVMFRAHRQETERGELAVGPQRFFGRRSTDARISFITAD